MLRILRVILTFCFKFSSMMTDFHQRYLYILPNSMHHISCDLFLLDSPLLYR